MNKGLYKISPRRQQRELKLNKVILYIIYFLMTKAFRSFLETDEDRYHNVCGSGALSRRWKDMSVEEIELLCPVQHGTGYRVGHCFSSVNNARTQFPHGKILSDIFKSFDGFIYRWSFGWINLNHSISN